MLIAFSLPHSTRLPIPETGLYANLSRLEISPMRKLSLTLTTFAGTQSLSPS